MTGFLPLLQQRVLILDGGPRFPKTDHTSRQPPELANRDDPAGVLSVHALYAEAGADILTTNSLGGNRSTLGRFGLERAVEELNRRAVELAQTFRHQCCLIAGCVGPTGRRIDPTQDVSFDEVLDVFAEQITVLARAGVDLIHLKSFRDIRELRAAVIACHDVCDLPVVSQMVFPPEAQRKRGLTPQAAAVTLDALRVNVIGAYCETGPLVLHEHVAQMQRVAPRAFMVQASALNPVAGGKTATGCQDHPGSTMETLSALGVRMVGGCSQTTPQWIRAIHPVLKNLKSVWTPPQRRSFLSSRCQVREFGGKQPCLLVGERLNPSGKPALSQALTEKRMGLLIDEAMRQVAAGAQLLDVNCYVPGLNEGEMLEQAVFALSEACPVPLVIDSSDPVALECALKAADGKVLINSVSGEKQSLARVIPLARRYGAAVVGMPLDDAGVPKTVTERIQIVRRIRDEVQAAGLPEHDLIIDGLALSLKANPEQVQVTLRTVNLVHKELGLATILGISNLSFGLADRSSLSSVFLVLALAAGLKAAIVNPLDQQAMRIYRAALSLQGVDHDTGLSVGCSEDQ